MELVSWAQAVTDGWAMGDGRWQMGDKMGEMGTCFFPVNYLHVKNPNDLYNVNRTISDALGLRVPLWAYPPGNYGPPIGWNVLPNGTRHGNGTAGIGPTALPTGVVNAAVPSNRAGASVPKPAAHPTM